LPSPTLGLAHRFIFDPATDAGAMPDPVVMAVPWPP